ncbi:hypothetical protein OBBRIDRAFT_836581 [Obba rivulosa]|uniref:Uncharacterized protein n=1 Tax=Obba rivulosa TaxID=1052685 RepID=A0A8E2ASF5_9APHY|nr:hypothetical protein OBBRIDRAFT_836581 [Obba rivulosa]
MDTSRQAAYSRSLAAKAGRRTTVGFGLPREEPSTGSAYRYTQAQYQANALAMSVSRSRCGLANNARLSHLPATPICSPSGCCAQRTREGDVAETRHYAQCVPANFNSNRNFAEAPLSKAVARPLQPCARYQWRSPSPGRLADHGVWAGDATP